MKTKLELLISISKVLLILIVVLFWGIIMQSCNPQTKSISKDYCGWRYIPFKEKSNDKWGLIDLKEGKIIGNRIWESSLILYPSQNNIILAKTTDNKFTYYSVGNEPKILTDKYESAGSFCEGYAAVANNDGTISIIDTKFNVVYTLSKYKEDFINEVGTFSEGLMPFKTSLDRWGYINYKGEVVIEPNFKEVWSSKTVLQKSRHQEVDNIISLITKEKKFCQTKHLIMPELKKMG
jgi:hypothetical protein